ncbi:hypothetical protein HK414_09445 [Ramlibacter terrae]|uniref:Tripartite tricarboxylate transporter substrate binding protein n=1 Tax=Ramlibacter terrae TaxID=2732511 RepID=A0ABX6P1S5_9BURK|nr:hypothetical protein HK414_09445 [Ramlibacter terrae]
MQKRFFLQALAAAAITMGFAAPAAAQWKPTKPINLIVPWAAGGSTDQITRVTAAEIEKVLGQKIIVVNQPGASGSIGSKNAWDAAKDGYTGRRAPRRTGHLPDAGHARRAGEGLAHVPERGQHRRGGRRRQHAVQDDRRTALGDEGEARRSQGRDRGRHVRRPQRHGGDLARHRREVPPRHLRRRQPCRGGHRVRRNRPDHPTRSGAGRNDPGQAHPAAGHRQRPPAGDRGLRHHRADQHGDPRLQGAGQLLRHLHPQGRAAGSGRHGAEDLDREHRQQRGHQGLCGQPRRTVRPGGG